MTENPTQPAAASSGSDDAVFQRQGPWPDRPGICTFALRLPFALRLDDGSMHTYQLLADFEDTDARALFGDKPFVRIRVHNEPLNSLDAYPHADAALRSMYGVDVPGSEMGRFEAGTAYEQWISLETPHTRLVGEDAQDAAYHFHRCLRALSLLLTSHNLLYHDARVYPVSTQDVGPIVYVGQYELSGQWSFAFPLLTHPERLPTFDTVPPKFGSHDNDFIWALNQLAHEVPFETALHFALRAERAGTYRGDLIDQVVSLQTAMESRLYATWRTLLVDRGFASSQIAQEVTGEEPYRRLLVTVLPQLLGGRWDTTASDSEVGEYWEKLYLLRNRAVHGGYTPNLGEADAARNAYDRMRHYVRERLWARRQDYPRTALVVIGHDGMAARGWRDQTFEGMIAELLAEPKPFYLPWDVAGRSRP